MATLTKDYQLVGSSAKSEEYVSGYRFDLYTRLYAKYTDQSIEKNESYITVKLVRYIDTTSVGISYSWYSQVASLGGTCSHNHSLSKSTTTSYSRGVEHIVFEENFTITHNDDGRRDVSFSATYDDSRTNQQNISVVYWSLPTIPRASSISFGEFTMDSPGEIKINRASDSFQHSISWAFGELHGDVIKEQEPTSDTIVYWAPDIELASQIPKDRTGVGVLTVKTHSDDGVIGENTYQFYCSLPQYVGPSIPDGGLVLTPESIALQKTSSNTDGSTVDILVKNKNRLTAYVSGCAAGVGSYITSYVIDGPSMSKTIQTPQDGFSVSVPYVSSIGELTYTVTVYDARGDQASIQQTIMCYDYYIPSFHVFNAYRANEDGTANVNGTYLKCECAPNYADVNKTNSVDIVASYNGESTKASDYNNGCILINVNNADKTYNVYLTIKDAYGGSSVSETATVFGSARILNITKDGRGFAIGKTSSKNDSHDNGLFECRWDAQFHGTTEMKDVATEQLNCTNITTGQVDCDSISINKQTVFDLIYPVGSIYMSVNLVDPSNIFGGTWERIEDRFLLGASDTYEAGTKDGEASVTLTIDQMPLHTHGTARIVNTIGAGTYITTAAGGDYGLYIGYDDTGKKYVDSSATGGDAAHNNMPPYLAVYMWKRTA